MIITNSNFLFLHWPDLKFLVFGFYFRGKVVATFSMTKNEIRFATKEIEL